MNNMKKLGLTALAGSLVASSAFAGDLSVTGSSKITFADKHDSEVTGNPFSMSQGVTFGGSGDLDNGMSMSWTYAMDNAAFSSSNIKIDMGDSGEFAFGNGSSVAGLKKYADNVPTAGEQVYDDVDTNDYGLADNMSNANMLGYNGTWGGVGVSLGWTKDTGGSDSSWVVTYDGLMDGLTIGAGMGNDGNASDDQTAWIKYASGGLTIAYQRSEVDAVATGTATQKSTHIGASFAVNEDLSVSVGRQEVDMGAGKTDEESTGLAASYTMGSLTIGAHSNKTDDVGGTSGSEDSVKEISIAFAF
jgi:outer membrane protein OmpU